MTGDGTNSISAFLLITVVIVFAMYGTAIIIGFFDGEPVFPFNKIIGFTGKYKKSNCYYGTKVRMKYDLMKKLYHVKPDRWVYGYVYGYGSADQIAYMKNDMTRVVISLSFIDWIRFLHDKKQYGKAKEREDKRANKAKEKLRSAEQLEEILNTAQKDIEKAMKEAEEEIESGKQGIKDCVKRMK